MMTINKALLGFIFLIGSVPVCASRMHESISSKATLITQVTDANKKNPTHCSKSLQNCTILISQNTGVCLSQLGSVSITNHSNIKAMNIAASSTNANFNTFVVQNNGCPSILSPGASCTISFFTNAPVDFSVSNVVVKGTNTNTSLFDIQAISCTTSTTLTTSVSTIALSVNNPLMNALTGNPRIITITNSGTSAATNVTYSPSPALPAGTTISPGSCGTIAPAGTCVLTITPGPIPSATPGNTSPTPITLTIAGSNTNTLMPTINVLSYGSVYQSGYIFSVDDTVNVPYGSIGGKVASLTDVGGTVWSSNATNTGTALDSIFGIAETSTTGTPVPNTGQLTGQTACNGNIDGACNSNNIITFYSLPNTNPPVNFNFYAAGLCKASMGGFNDWYMPAICEMGYTGNIGDNAGCGVAGFPTIQNMQSNLVDNGNIGGLAGNHWSSTELASDPINGAFRQFFAAPPGSAQILTFKASFPPVRCARVITP